jgi:hypothetical protein
VKQSVLPLKRYLIGYKTAQFLDRFVAGQLSPEDLHVVLGVGRRPTSVQKDLYTEIFS